MTSSQRKARSTIEQQAFDGEALPEAYDGLPSEIDRVRLIAQLTRLMHEPCVPAPTREAGLTVVGWLARRLPGEASHSLGCDDLETTLVRQVAPATASDDPPPSSVGPRSVRQLARAKKAE
jgi:hypothetical protein